MQVRVLNLLDAKGGAVVVRPAVLWQLVACVGCGRGRGVGARPGGRHSRGRAAFTGRFVCFLSRCAFPFYPSSRASMRSFLTLLSACVSVHLCVALSLSRSLALSLSRSLALSLSPTLTLSTFQRRTLVADVPELLRGAAPGQPGQQRVRGRARLEPKVHVRPVRAPQQRGGLVRAAAAAADGAMHHQPRRGVRRKHAALAAVAAAEREEQRKAAGVVRREGQAEHKARQQRVRAGPLPPTTGARALGARLALALGPALGRPAPRPCHGPLRVLSGWREGGKEGRKGKEERKKEEG